MSPRTLWTMIGTLALALTACSGNATNDAGTDAGVDAGTDAGADAGTDAGVDAGTDASADAGVDVDADAGTDAGRPCYAPVDCAMGKFCQHPDGMCIGPGMCVPVPDAATCAADAPVCGCDGMDYASACAAHAAHVSVAADGMCTPGGCTRDGDCTPDGGSLMYCKYANNVCGGVGICTLAPLGVSCPFNCDPNNFECGCDGMTYVNDCYRNRALTSVAHSGLCGGDPPPCTP